MNIQTIGVCGAGTMGSGIAQVAAQSGFNTILFDVNIETLEKSKHSIEKNLTQLVEKQKISVETKLQTLEHLAFTNVIENCKADLIIEAIIENLEIKTDLFNQLAGINPLSTIFASNTSSISIKKIAEATSVKDRIIGMHFFNPATIMKLVEVISTEYTSKEITNTVLEVCKQINKTAVECKDSPGFIVNRVARHYYLEAMKLIELNLTTIETIDEALENAGFKMGAFKLMDLIGLDINYSVSEIVYNAMNKPERLKPSLVQQQKVAAGELGKKTGKGFYEYKN
jgi:3-hydroxybutyryl-CoA dehydrogenase